MALRFGRVTNLTWPAQQAAGPSFKLKARALAEAARGPAEHASAAGARALGSSLASTSDRGATTLGGLTGRLGCLAAWLPVAWS